MFISMEDCSFWGVPIWPTGGLKASHWPIQSIRNTGFLYTIGSRSGFGSKPGLHSRSELGSSRFPGLDYRSGFGSRPGF